jgi:predicted nucleotidyltransferase
MTGEIRALLNDFQAALQRLYGERLAEVVLYGSHARDEADEESDVDVMVVLRGPIEPAREIRRLSRLAVEIGLIHEKFISTFPISEEDYHSKESSMLQNVRREGITV